MGPQTIAALIENGLIEDEADIFYLTAEPLLALEGFAEKKVENLLASIEAAKSRPFEQTLTSLGIDGIGSTVGRTNHRELLVRRRICWIAPVGLKRLRRAFAKTVEGILDDERGSGAGC